MVNPSVSQGILRIFWNSKIHHRIYTSAPSDPILSHLNPLYNINPNFLTIHFNVPVQPTPTFSKLPTPFVLSDQNSISRLL